MDPVPPVIDVARQARIETPIQEAQAKSLFSPMNIGALVLILLVLFFLFKRYRDKHNTEKAHQEPSPIQ